MSFTFTDIAILSDSCFSGLVSERPQLLPADGVHPHTILARAGEQGFGFAHPARIVTTSLLGGVTVPPDPVAP
jgi:hypothetical protein